MRNGKVRILLASPESLLHQHQKLISDLAEANMICAVAVDEAHCVIKYGYGRKTQKGKKIAPFRPAYSNILRIRAIVGNVPLVALTATASSELRNKIIKELKMRPCFSLVLPPRKDNLMYIVHKLPKDYDIKVYFGWLQALIKKDSQIMEKMIVFFHKVEKLSATYEYLDHALKSAGHVGDPPHDDTTHLFEMYHMKTDDSIKTSVLQSFSQPDGNMRCVLASSSFSMGLNIPNIKFVIHFGVAMDLDDFLQETGRSGRAQEKAVSIVLLYPRCLNGTHISQGMKNFVKTKTCRRLALLEQYDDNPKSIEPKHDCCDNCANLCECGTCPISPLEKLGIIKDSSDSEEDEMADMEIDTAMGRTDISADTTAISSDKASVSTDSSESDSNSDCDSDSDLEVFRRKPVLVLSDSE